jgi:hypothetical protein
MVSTCVMSAAKLADLLGKSDPRGQMLVWIFDANRLAPGRHPLRSGRIIDLVGEQVASGRATTGNVGPRPAASLGETEVAAAVAVTVRRAAIANAKGIRRSGEYWFELMGHRTDCGSSKELLSKALCALEDARPGTLEKLAHVRPCTRRIVARQPRDLFVKDHLVNRFAQRLTHGWWYGTNNSRRETTAWLRRTCTCAGLDWGTEFRTNLNHASNCSDEL